MTNAELLAEIERREQTHLGLAELLTDSLLQLKSALRGVEAAREALKPFADACAKADAHKAEFERAGMGTVSDSATPGWGVRYGHLKAAREVIAALSEVTP